MKLQNIVKKNVYCINLKKRSEKKKFMKKQAKKIKLPIKFFNAILDKKNPANGCLQSHLKIIKLAKSKKLPYVLILEDDCVFTKTDLILPPLPQKWEMLYLGGNIDQIFSDKQEQWVNMSCWTTHSYIIHSSIYDLVINGLQNTDKEVDRYFRDIIHQRKKSYMLSYHLTIQKDGYSDIQKKSVSYAMYNPEDKLPIDEASHEFDDNNNYRLKLKNFTDKELPYVSILTPTKNRRKFFKMAILNFNNFDYPKDKLEWIIVDDGTEDLSDILPVDNRIKYIKIKPIGNLTVSYKRNLCVKYATYDYFVHMDDDDYYHKFSIISRIKTLLTYPEKQIVGCGMCCCFDTQSKKFYVIGNKYQMSEASMAYTRTFFNKCNFNERIKLGEGILFLKKRKYQAIQIPYSFILYVINHKTNITKSLRQNTNERYYIEGPSLPDNVLSMIDKL